MESKRGGKNGEPLPWYTAQLDDMWGKYEKTMRELRRTELLDRLPGEQGAGIQECIKRRKEW